MAHSHPALTPVLESVYGLPEGAVAHFGGDTAALIATASPGREKEIAMKALAKFAATNAYHQALEAGLTHEEAKQREATAKAKIRADEAVEEPVRAAFNRLHHERSQFGAEANRLRRERDALLRCLAEQMGVSESTAWQVARLDMEEAD